MNLFRSIVRSRGLLVLLGTLCALVSGAAAQLPAIPADTPGMSIPEMFYLHAKNMDMKLLPTPLITRTNAGERPYLIESARGKFSPTLGNLLGSDPGCWVCQAKKYGIKLIYTGVSGMPHWWAEEGSTGTTPTVTTAPYDIDQTGEQCLAIGGNPAYTSPNGDCIYQEFWHNFMQKICNVPRTPKSPVAGQCQIQFFESGNEFNVNGFWTDTPAHLAKMFNDQAVIVRKYCADCMIIGGSVSAGGDGYAPKFAAGGGQYDNALGQLLDAWHAIPNASLPDAISFHMYPGHTNVAPPPFPEVMYSNSDVKCLKGAVPNKACRGSLLDQVNTIRGIINARPWLRAKNPPIFNTEFGFNGNSTLQVDTETVSYTDEQGISHAGVTIAGPNSWKLRQAYVARAAMVAGTSGVAVNLWYQADSDCYGTLIVGIVHAKPNSNPGCRNDPVLLPVNTSGPHPFTQVTGNEGLLPTGVAFNTIYGWLHGARVVRPPANVSGDVWAMDIVDAKGGADRIVWNTNWMRSELYQTNYGTATDLDEQRQPVAGGVVTIENRPILLSGLLSGQTSGKTHAAGQPR